MGVGVAYLCVSISVRTYVHVRFMLTRRTNVFTNNRYLSVGYYICLKVYTYIFNYYMGLAMKNEQVGKELSEYEKMRETEQRLVEENYIGITGQRDSIIVSC